MGGLTSTGKKLGFEDPVIGQKMSTLTPSQNQETMMRRPYAYATAVYGGEAMGREERQAVEEPRPAIQVPALVPEPKSDVTVPEILPIKYTQPA